MDFNQIKRMLEKEDVKIIIVENGQPLMVISRYRDYQQLDLDKKAREIDNIAKKSRETQSTETITREEMPLEELRVEDLPL